MTSTCSNLDLELEDQPKQETTPHEWVHFFTLVHKTCKLEHPYLLCVIDTIFINLTTIFHDRCSAKEPTWDYYCFFG